MKYELNFLNNDGGDAYLLQSVAIHFNQTVFRLWSNLTFKNMGFGHFNQAHLPSKFPDYPYFTAMIL